MTDHPHARGERFRPTIHAHARSGSSPRSWGTAPPLLSARPADRIIPTLVGNGRSPWGSALIRTDHPHARGERASRHHASRASPDHPHARGERARGAGTVSLINGSSPRSWGTAVPLRAAPPRGRIIPTLVGNGDRWSFPFRPLSDHPHARGERDAGVGVESAGNGSSPRSWGTARRTACSTRPRRIIPTLVGNGALRRWPSRPCADHPHARGERVRTRGRRR